MIAKSFMSAEDQALKYSHDLKNVMDTDLHDGYKKAKNEAWNIEGKIENQINGYKLSSVWC